MRACFPPDCNFNPIRVRSVTHAKEVDTRILGEYLLFGSFTDAWAAGCTLADVQWNSESIPEDNFVPEGDDAARTLGKCSACDKAKPLTSMIMLTSREYICNICATSETSPDKPQQDEPAGSDPLKQGGPRKPGPPPDPGSLNQIQLALGLNLSEVAREHISLGIAHVHRRRFIRNISDSIERKYLVRQTTTERVYRDAYIESERVVPLDRAARTRGPLNAELEAHRPLVGAPDYLGLTRQTAKEAVGIHYDNNLGVIASKLEATSSTICITS